MDFIHLPILYKFIFLFGVSTILSLIIIKLAVYFFKKINLLDHPERYPHEGKRKPIPYGLGFVLYLNFLIISIFFLDLSYSKLVIILILGAFVTIINFIDDLDTISKTIFKIPPAFRLVIQILIGAVIGITSIKIGYISNIFGGILQLDQYYFIIGSIKIYIIPLIFTIVWYVLVFNSINWSDAIPGITSGLSFIALLIIFILTVKLYFLDTSLVAKENSIFVLGILSILMPSILLLWIFDVKKKFLIGDSGTMFIAFMIATVAIVSGGKVATVAAVLGIYLIDAFYVIFMRLYNKKNPLKGDMIHHLHFRLGKMGFSHNFIRGFVYSLSFLFGLGAIFLDKIGKIILFAILILIIIFITKIISLKNKRVGYGTKM